MGSEIGIKLADGSFYSVLEQDFTGRKKLVVTTARDNQDSVQIDLYRGSGEGAEAFIGSLMIENIQPAPKREPEIELQVGLDSRGNLEAVASDPLSGEQQSLSVSLPSLGTAETTPLEELDLEGETQARPAPRAEPVAEARLAGESYPVGATDRRKAPLEPRRPRVLAVIGFVLLGLLVLAGAAYLIYRLLDGERIPRLFGGTGESTLPQAGEAAAAPEPAQPKPAEAPAAAPEAEQAGRPGAASRGSPSASRRNLVPDRLGRHPLGSGRHLLSQPLAVSQAGQGQQDPQPGPDHCGTSTVHSEKVGCCLSCSFPPFR